jgi:hypothetical protein
MARNDVYLNINALSPADAVVTGQQDMTAATVPELVLGDTPTFNFYFTDNTNVWPSWAGNASYTLTWALSDAVAGDFAPAATTGNATPITGGWSVILPLNSYDLVGLLNTKRVGQPYPVTNLWQQLRVTDPSGNEVTRAMFWTPVRYRAISDTQNTESASPTGGRFVTVNNVNTLTTPTAAQFYAANPVPTSALGTAANGELLIGNGTGFTKSTLTAGTGITVTNGSGSITIDATGAQETLTATVKNAESVAITKGQVVYLFSATGGFPSVKLAYNTTDATSAKTFGVVSDTSIAPNGTGTVTCVGVVSNLNLGTYSDGDTVYLGATPGSFTATKPYAPNHLVYVGIIERANAGNGELYVRIQNGYELDEIHDVQITTPKLAGQTLIYDQTNDLWKNAQLTGTANQITVTNADAAVTLSIPTAVANVNSLTAQSATNLTLNGGSSGASLVLGQGASGLGVISTPVSAGSIAALALRMAADGTSANDVAIGFIASTAAESAPNAVKTAMGVIRNQSYGRGHIAWYINRSANSSSYTSSDEVMRLAYATGNLLLGTTTDSGNGKLQLATHTTSAGGIGFGPSSSLYIAGPGDFRFVSSSTEGAITLLSGGTYVGSVTSGKSTYLVSGGGVTALTLDSSQRCILAGALRLNNAYVSGAPTATGYVTLQDSAGNTYKVLVGT